MLGAELSTYQDFHLQAPVDLKVVCFALNQVTGDAAVARGHLPPVGRLLKFNRPSQVDKSACNMMLPGSPAGRQLFNLSVDRIDYVSLRPLGFV